MKIDFSKPILGIGGKPIKIQDVEGQPDFTLRDVCSNALVTDVPSHGARPDESKIDGAEKLRRTRLADRIFGCKEPINLSVDDVSLLKKRIDAVYGTLTTARAWAILEGEDAGETGKDGDAPKE